MNNELSKFLRAVGSFCLYAVLIFMALGLFSKALFYFGVFNKIDSILDERSRKQRESIMAQVNQVHTVNAHILEELAKTNKAVQVYLSLPITAEEMERARAFWDMDVSTNFVKASNLRRVGYLGNPAFYKGWNDYTNRNRIKN